MATRVNREEFKAALNRVEAGLSSRPFIEQSTCYVFQDGWVSTYNEEISVTTETGLPDNLVAAVPSKPLLNVLDKIGCEQIKIDATASEFLITAPGHEIALRMQKEIVLPINEITLPAKGGWHNLPSDFGAAVEKVVGAAGTNTDEFRALCVRIHPEFIEATDRWQMCRYHLDTGVAEPFLVRAKSLEHLAKLDVTKIGTTKEWVHFRNKTLMFSCRRHMEDYFDMDDQFDFTGAKAVLPSGGVSAAEIAQSFCDSKDNDKALVRVSKNQMVVMSQGNDGRSRSPLEMTYAGPDQEFRILPKMLIQLIRDNRDCEIGPFKLCVRGERWCYVTTLGKPESNGHAEPAGDEYADAGE
jgi:hypothetical protein